MSTRHSIHSYASHLLCITAPYHETHSSLRLRCLYVTGQRRCRACVLQVCGQSSGQGEYGRFALQDGRGMSPPSILVLTIVRGTQFLHPIVPTRSQVEPDTVLIDDPFRIIGTLWEDAPGLKEDSSKDAWRNWRRRVARYLYWCATDFCPDPEPSQRVSSLCAGV